MQATVINNAAVTTITNGIATTVPAVAANIQFVQSAITAAIAMLGGLIGIVFAVVLVASRS
jgi:zinc transporter ZupT